MLLTSLRLLFFISKLASTFRWINSAWHDCYLRCLPLCFRYSWRSPLICQWPASSSARMSLVCWFSGLKSKVKSENSKTKDPRACRSRYARDRASWGYADYQALRFFEWNYCPISVFSAKEGFQAPQFWWYSCARGAASSNQEAPQVMKFGWASFLPMKSSLAYWRTCRLALLVWCLFLSITKLVWGDSDRTYAEAFEVKEESPLC